MDIITTAAVTTAAVLEAQNMDSNGDLAAILAALGNVASGNMSTTEAFEILDDGLAARNPSFMRDLTALLQDYR